MSPSLWLAVYCVLILLASLAGGWIPMLVKLTHKRMELAVSFVAGVMLGVGVLHMLPHAVMARLEASHEHVGELGHEGIHDLFGPLLLWLLAGFLVMFLIERFFHFHYHDAPAAQQITEAEAQASGDDHQHDHNHDQHHAHHYHGKDHHHAPAHHHGLTGAAAFVGLSLHSLIEGVALASSVEVARQVGHTETAALAGLGTFLVIFLHKPFDSLTLGALLAFGGRSIKARHIVNVAFSLLIPVGVAIFYLGLMGSDNQSHIASYALAFSAGTFLCISMSDLLPELQFHRHDRVKLSASLLTGLAVAWGISVLEAGMHKDHNHVHPAQPTSQSVPGLVVPVESVDSHEHVHDDHDGHAH